MRLLLLLLSSLQWIHGFPRDLLYDFIQHANHSIDPCDDFFLHVCPNAAETANFPGVMMDEYFKIVDSVKGQHLDGVLHHDDSEKFSATLWKFFDTEQAVDFCIDQKEKFSKMTRVIVPEWLTDGRVENWEQVPCHIQFALIRNATSDHYKRLRVTFIGAINGAMVRSVLGDLGARTRNFFEKMRNVTREEFKKTPWAQNKNVVDKFVNVLDSIPFDTAENYQENAWRGLAEHQKSLKNCHRTLTMRASRLLSAVICDTVAISDGWNAADFRLEHYGFTGNMSFAPYNSIVSDLSNGVNGWDKFVSMGVLGALPMISDHDALIYGAVGTPILHEFMHSFVFGFDDGDYSNLKSLWTNSSDCVSEQMQKTCQTYPTTKCREPKYTFEEDAADLAAYRIAWKSYLSTLTPEGLRDTEELKLFFYGFPTVFCMKWDPIRGAIDPHSSWHHRVNSLTSQMNEFAELFKCKETDRMVMNKARHCVLYGEDASQNKRLGRDSVAMFG